MPPPVFRQGPPAPPPLLPLHSSPSLAGPVAGLQPPPAWLGSRLGQWMTAGLPGMTGDGWRRRGGWGGKDESEKMCRLEKEGRKPGTEGLEALEQMEFLM